MRGGRGLELGSLSNVSFPSIAINAGWNYYDWRLMDPTLDAWFNLALMILRHAIVEARAGNVEARSFLYEPCAEWLMESLGLDVDRVRAKLVREWAHEATLT